MLNLIGLFVQEIGTPNFFILTEEGKFLYSDPQWKGGTNIITRTDIKLSDWEKEHKTRSKTNCRIKDYCGEDVIFMEKI